MCLLRGARRSFKSGKWLRAGLLGAFALALMGSLSASPMRAQTTIGLFPCSVLGTTETCFGAAPVAVTNNPANPSTITISVISPAGLAVATAVAADTAGNTCTPTSGAGTLTLTLTCPSGLQAAAPTGGSPQSTISMTFSLAQAPPPQKGEASLTFNANQANAIKDAAEFFYPPPPPTGPPGLGVVAYPAGWNLICGPFGWGPLSTQISGPLYTYQASDTSYETAPAGSGTAGGNGFWAYFPAPTTVDSAGQAVGLLPVLLPSSHWVMIGDPSYGPATVRGTDVIYTYSPATGSYQQATTLQPGQGAWAYSAKGSVATVAGQ